VLEYRTPVQAPAQPLDLGGVHWAFIAGVVAGGFGVTFYFGRAGDLGGEGAFCCLAASPLVLLWATVAFGVGLHHAAARARSRATASPWLALALGIVWPSLFVMPIAALIGPAYPFVFAAVPYAMGWAVVRRIRS
jgi:hypothetical protein